MYAIWILLVAAQVRSWPIGCWDLASLGAHAI